MAAFGARKDYTSVDWRCGVGHGTRVLCFANVLPGAANMGPFGVEDSWCDFLEFPTTPWEFAQSSVVEEMTVGTDWLFVQCTPGSPDTRLLEEPEEQPSIWGFDTAITALHRFWLAFTTWQSSDSENFTPLSVIA